MPLIGKTLILREQRPEDMAYLTELRNNMPTQAWNKSLPPDYTVDMHRKRFESREFSYDPDQGLFMIEIKESGELAGNISYSSLERRHACNIGIMVGEKFWGTGAGLEAQEILLNFLFTEIGLQVVRIWTHSGNPRAIKLAVKSGFRMGGVIREACFKNGKMLDTVMLDILREEYFALHPELKDGMLKIEY